MLLFWKLLKVRLTALGSVAVDVYTTGSKNDVKKSIILFITCCLFSTLLSAILLLYLLYMLSFEPDVAGGISICFGIVLTIALYISKQVRCIGILFLISCFMKKSRNLLLTAGVTFIVLRNIKNTLENVTSLVRSMVCNLEAKKAALYITPLENYINMLKYIVHILGQVKDLGLVKFDSELHISPTIDSDTFLEKILNMKQNLNETAKSVHAVVNTLSSVSHKMYPVVSFFLLMLFITLHIKKYCNNVKYKNKFISSKFRCFDEKQKLAGKPHILPLTPEEETMYISIPSWHPTAHEGKAMVKFGIPVLSHFLAWILFISVDALVYYFVDVVTRRLSELEPFTVPLLVKVKIIKNILGIATESDEIPKDFSFSVTLFEKKCLPNPKILFYDSVAPLAVILTALLIMAMMAAKITQLRLMVCERFFASSAEERIEHLHAKILKQRLKNKRVHANGASLGFIFKVGIFLVMGLLKTYSMAPMSRWYKAGGGNVYTWLAVMSNLCKQRLPMNTVHKSMFVV